MIPDYWIEFLNNNNLRNIEIEIPDEMDLSELDGGGLKIFDEEGIFEESTKFYPGIAVKNDGYLPIASCLQGSGDPYFINCSEGPAGRLYRIYHDEVSDEGYTKEAVNIVLSNYEKLLELK